MILHAHDATDTRDRDEWAATADRENLTAQYLAHQGCRFAGSSPELAQTGKDPYNPRPKGA